MKGISEADFKWMERVAKKQLGIKEFKSDPTCGNYQYVREDCKNTNLDKDGFCQICDHYHWQIHFGKMHKSNATRQDAGCNTFGDGGQNNQFGSELIFIGTGQLATQSNEYNVRKPYKPSKKARKSKWVPYIPKDEK